MEKTPHGNFRKQDRKKKSELIHLLGSWKERRFDDTMAGQKQPIELVKAKGRKHLTKAEIEERENSEVVAPDDHVEPPAFLTAKQKKVFQKLAEELAEIKLVANVDCEALARLVIAQEQFVEVTKMMKKTPLMVEVPVYEIRENSDTGEKEHVQVGTRLIVNGEREKLMIIQDRCMKQCRQGASDFGMTVSSRCRLAVPKPREDVPTNKFAKYAN